LGRYILPRFDRERQRPRWRGVDGDDDQDFFSSGRGPDAQHKRPELPKLAKSKSLSQDNIPAPFAQQTGHSRRQWNRPVTFSIELDDRLWVVLID
jgi:hypothetical protein